MSHQHVAYEQSAAIISKGGGDGNGSSTTPVTATASNAAAYPSIVSEFNYYMGPDEVDAKKCLGWKDADGEWSPRCAPLGGNSVWSVAGYPLALGYGGESDNVNDNEDGGQHDANNNNRPVILLATTIDSTSMFHHLSPGVNNATSNTLTLLLAAKLVGSFVKDDVQWRTTPLSRTPCAPGGRYSLKISHRQIIVRVDRQQRWGRSREHGYVRTAHGVRCRCKYCQLPEESGV